ncbi:MAG: hypothetical protein H7327_10830 [Herminiimonas sp.]|nr:hypothetical protein [Herminiimonas sp.]
MAISPVAASAAASKAQSSAAVAVVQAKAANQQSLLSAQPDEQKDNPALQAPAAKPTVNTNGQTIGTTVNVTA